MNNLAVTYQAAGKLDLALPLFEETLRLKKVKLGADNQDTLATANKLGSAYQQAGKFDLALSLLDDLLASNKVKADKARQYIGNLSPRSANEYVLRATKYETVGDQIAALADYEKALEIDPN